MARAIATVRVEGSHQVQAQYRRAEVMDCGIRLPASVHVHLGDELSVWGDADTLVAVLREALGASLAAITAGREKEAMKPEGEA